MIKKSLYKNTVFAFLLQFSNLLYPLITAPYISRVLGADGIGKVDFSSSVVSWFVLLATFGTMTYGVREVAKIRDNQVLLSRFFSEVFILKIVATVLTFVIYLPCILFIERFSQDYILFLVQGVVLLFNVFSLDWFFQGVEDYKYITIRSISMKVISLVALFMLVKAEEDYLIYAGIFIFALSFSNILNFIYIRKYVRINLMGLNFRQHVKQVLVFFASSMVISIYALLDQVLLGFLKGDTAVALYARAKMLLASGMVLSMTVSNVIMPRLNNYFLNNKEKYTELLKVSADMMLMISIPVMIGTAVLAKQVMLLFGGHEFVPATIALIIISPLAVIVPIGMWNYQQRLLPLRHETIGLYVQIAMATISVVSNIILIPIIGFVGVAISYLLAETTGTIIGFIYLQRKDGFRTFTLRQLRYVIAALVMGGSLVLIQLLISVSWLSLIASIFSGVAVYLMLLITMQERVTMMMLVIVRSKLGK